MLYAAGKRRQKARIQKTERNKKQNKNSDTINTLLHTSYQGAVETLNIDGTDRKIVRIPVDRTFNEEVYFLLNRRKGLFL